MKWIVCYLLIALVTFIISSARLVYKCRTKPGMMVTPEQTDNLLSYSLIWPGLLYVVVVNCLTWIVYIVRDGVCWMLNRFVK
jgi:hypothetical protein